MIVSPAKCNLQQRTIAFCQPPPSFKLRRASLFPLDSAFIEQIIFLQGLSINNVNVQQSSPASSQALRRPSAPPPPPPTSPPATASTTHERIRHSANYPVTHQLLLNNTRAGVARHDRARNCRRFFAIRHVRRVQLDRLPLTLSQAPSCRSWS